MSLRGELWLRSGRRPAGVDDRGGRPAHNSEQICEIFSGALGNSPEARLLRQVSAPNGS